MERLVKRVVQGTNAVDGAGVRLARVLGLRTVKDYDPFLMLDSFDSQNPQDYILGFPMHPHRGIETITYLVEGEIIHQDSLGNKGIIRSGGMQWMTSGSGILHEEMPQPCPRMLGLQLWLNLPQNEKMTSPKYFDIPKESIPIVKEESGTLRVISGTYKGVHGVTPHHIQASLWDITVEPGREMEVPTLVGQTVFIFLLSGDAEIGNLPFREKSALLFGEGDLIRVKALEDHAARFLFVQAPPLHQSVAWGGPIVMNTQEELDQAFRELRMGTFIRT